MRAHGGRGGHGVRGRRRERRCVGRLNRRGRVCADERRLNRPAEWRAAGSACPPTGLGAVAARKSGAESGIACAPSRTPTGMAPGAARHPLISLGLPACRGACRFSRAGGSRFGCRGAGEAVSAGLSGAVLPVVPGGMPVSLRAGPSMLPPACRTILPSCFHFSSHRPTVRSLTPKRRAKSALDVVTLPPGWDWMSPQRAA
jgi:hypothetical protein